MLKFFPSFKLFVFLTLIVVGNISLGQYSVEGVVQNKSDRQPLPFANVILALPETDSIVLVTGSDLNGEFALKNIKRGVYRLTIDFMGMKPMVMDSLSIFKNVDLGTITLTSGVQLEEVVITSKKRNVDLSIDKKTFSIAENPAALGGNATDVLNNLPSVDVDQNGNVSLRGSSELRILIDGKPTGLQGEDIGIVLAQIPANTIDNIEIITVPTAKYDAESSGGIINIKLKENKIKGSSGNLNFNYGNFDKLNLSALLGLKKKKFNLNVSYGLRSGTFHFDRYSFSENSTIDSLTSFIIEGTGEKKNYSHLGKLNLNFQPNKKTEFGLNSTLSSGLIQNDRTTFYTWEYLVQEATKNKRLAASEKSKLNLVNGIYFKNKLKKEGSLSISSTHAHVSSNNEGKYDETDLLQNEVNLLNSHEFIQNLDLKLPYKKSVWEFGGQHTHRIITNDFSYTSNSSAIDDIQNDFNYFDDITAGYIMESLKLNSWKISAGYRIEYTYSSSKNTSTDLNIQRDYFMHFPSFNLSKKVNKSNDLGFNYSRRITRPNAIQLNPSPSLADPFSLHAGNPDLTPATNDVSELTWLTKSKKITLQSTVFYQLRKNRVRRIRFVDDQGVSTVKWVNYDREDYYGLEVFTRLPLGKNFTINLSANVYERITDGSNINQGYTARYFGWDGKINLSLKLPKGFLLLSNGEYKSPKEIVIGTIEARYFIDCAIQKKILHNKGKLGLRLADVFNSKRFEIATLVNNWDQSGIYNRESRILFLSFSYNFGKKKGIK